MEADRKGESPNFCLEDLDCVVWGGAIPGGAGLVIGVVSGFIDDEDDTERDGIRPAVFLGHSGAPAIGFSIAW